MQLLLTVDEIFELLRFVGHFVLLLLQVFVFVLELAGNVDELVDHFGLLLQRKGQPLLEVCRLLKDFLEILLLFDFNQFLLHFFLSGQLE